MREYERLCYQADLEFKKCLWRKNCNPSEWMQGKKVGIARDNVCRLATDGLFQELVVVWIPTLRYDIDDVNRFSLFNKTREKFEALDLRHIWVEF